MNFFQHLVHRKAIFFNSVVGICVEAPGSSKTRNIQHDPGHDVPRRLIRQTSEKHTSLILHSNFYTLYTCNSNTVDTSSSSTHLTSADEEEFEMPLEKKVKTS